MIDFHCHLDLYSEPAHVLRGCAKRGLNVLSVTTTPTAWYGTSKLVQPRIKTALGLHPQLAHERKEELGLFDELLPQTRYVGEVGLDGSPQFKAHWNDQLTVFNHILNACSNVGGRLMSIHSRQASRPVLDCLEAHPKSGIPVLHWFTGSARDLDRAIQLGCWFSVGPSMLNSERGMRLTASMPCERVLTESDGPFAQLNGRAILPWEVDKAVAVLADLWQSDKRKTQDTLNDNLERLINRS